MSINYNSIVGNKEKVTMPSVDSWGTNNNILKDPPKSITTRRIDKVNQDGSINELMYQSGDRFAEVLNVYARGTNPMVSVQYNNQNGNPVKQPYRIIRDGAFRPPILTQAQLLPLSRQPRNVTQAITNKEFIDYSKKVTCAAPDSKRYFKDLPIQGPVIASKYIRIEVPTEQFVINHVNENPLITSARTNLSAKGNVQIDNNVTSDKEVLQYARTTNLSAKGNVQIDNNVTSDKEVLQYARATNPSGNTVQNYIHDDINLERNVPLTSAATLKTSRLNNAINAPDADIVLSRNLPEYTITSSKAIPHATYISDSHNTNHKLTQKTFASGVIANKTATNDSQKFTRTFNLKPSLDVGEFSGRGTIPPTERLTKYNSNYKTDKLKLAERTRDYMPPRLVGRQ
jgi:hypothetical protein